MIECVHTEFIDHKDQRYDTAGDYWIDDRLWYIRVSDTEDWRHKYLIMIHELIEMALCKHHSIDFESIDDFDMDGEGANHPDPGSLASAPYHNEHVLATQIEKRVAKMLGVNWKDYNDALNALEYKQ